MPLKIKHADTAPETVTLGSVRSRARDETQVEIDGDAERLSKAWEAAGKPAYETLTALDAEGNPSAEFAAAAKVWYVVDADERSEVKRYIRRACLLHKGLPVYAADTKNDDGTVTVGFTYAPPAVKAEAPSSASPTDEGSTATPGQGTPDTPDQENPDDGPTGRRHRG